MVERQRFILERGGDKKVLHLGCTTFPNLEFRIQTGSLLHQKLLDVTGYLVRIDIDREGLQLMKHRLGIEKLYCHDVQDLDTLELNEKFDVVIAGDIIEHLDNPGLFLRGVKRFLTPEGIMIITTSNAFTLLGMLKILFGIEGVHSDHRFYFSYSTLLRLLSVHSFHISEFYLTYPPSRIRPTLFYLIDKLSAWVSPYFASHIVLVARLNNCQ